MFESFGFEDLTPQAASVWFALGLGLVFGALAQVTRFCIRRAVAGDPDERRPALGIWLTALATAVIGTQVAVLQGWVDFSEHRFMVSELPLAAILAGGILFGAGMVLTRGCVSRLTVLGGSGNTRALLVLVVFSVVAHATLKGVLAPLRTALGAWTVDLGEAVSLAALPGGGTVWAAVIVLGALALALNSGASRRDLALAAVIGLLVPLGWAGTGFILHDDFDPIALESLSFTSPAAETLFWTIASTSIPAGFGTGLVGGVLIGAALSAVLRGEFRWVGFEGPAQTGRYTAGAAMMGVGGVLAGGCTVGAGLSGIPTLSVAALLALAAIVAGARLAVIATSGTRPTMPVPAE